MATYGAWTQGADVTGTSTYYRGHDLRQTRTISGEETQHPDGGLDPAVISTAINDERVRAEPAEYLSADIFDRSIGASTYVDVGPTSENVSPQPFSTGVVRDDAGLIMDASSVIADLRATYAASIALPPDATGVELESNNFAPTAVSVDLPMGDRVINGLGGLISVTTPMRVDFYVRPGDTGLASFGTLVLSHTTRGDEIVQVDTLTISAGATNLAPGNGAVIIWPESRPAASPAWGVNDASGRSGYWGVGRALLLDSAPTATWTLRPPRHRFVYGTRPPRDLAPCRQAPRDDQFSSARRIWPPPSSEQGGSRRLGYH